MSIRTIVLSAALAAGLAACGSDGASGPTFSDSVSTADAQSAARVASAMAGDIIGFANFSGPGFAAGMPNDLPQFGVALGAAPLLTPGRRGASTFLSAGPLLSGAIQLASSEGCTVSSHGFYQRDLRGAEAARGAVRRVASQELRATGLGS